MSTDIEVRRLTADDHPSVVDVFCEAFFDYPVMRWTLGPRSDYPSDLRELVDFFVRSRVLRGEAMYGVLDGDALVAAATTSRTDLPSPDAVAELSARTWERLGEEARSRYGLFGAAVVPFMRPEAHLHLNMIGVREGARGHGFGGALLRAVHEASASDPTSAGVSLTTEVPDNVPLYRHFGYEVEGEARVGDAFTSWTFFRPDAPGR